MNRPKVVDFVVRPHGTVWKFEPMTERAKSFVRTDLDVQGWRWLDQSFGVDHRPANDLITALEGEGFVLET